MRLVDHYLQIRDITLYNKNVKNDFKVVALGDIHLSKSVDKIKITAIKKQIKEEKADYNVFLGDFVSTPKELENKEIQEQLLDLIASSAVVAPTMIILGNHDFINKNKDKNNKYSIENNKAFWEKVISINNVYLLDNKLYQDNQVLFMGYKETLKYYYNNESYEDLEVFFNDFKSYPKLYKNLPKDIIKIGLIHSPEYAKLEKNNMLLRDYDLLISGHNHDGCIPFGFGNFTFGIISPKKKIFPKEARGYRVLNTGTSLLISGGITKIQECAPKVLHPFNHLCPMQMDTITFTNKLDHYKISKRVINVKNKRK